ncbi:MFS transporter [Cohnella sp.]|uniref:MFS transporter n=1 Tax=Cohnella sp. TaxID=1883426 RepID=UPI0035665844
MVSISNNNLKPVVIVALITAVSLFGDSMLYVALPIHWEDAGLASLLEVGILLSANRFIRLPFNPLISWLYRKVSVRSGLLFAVFISGITTLSYGFANGFFVWLILRCIWGIAWSFFRLGAYFMILDLSSNQNRGHFMGTYNGLYRLGSLIGMLAGGAFVDLFGMREVAVVFGILAFLVLPVVFYHVPNSKSKAFESQKMDEVKVKKQPILLWTLTSAFLVMLCLEGMFTAILSHLIDTRLQTGIHVLGMVVGAATLAGGLQASRWAVGPFLSPWVGKQSDGKWGRRPFLVGSLLLSSVFMASINFDLPFGLWLLNIFVILLVSSILATVLGAYASDITSGTSRAATMTLYVIVVDVGASFGPVLGYLSERFIGLTLTFWISAFILFLLSMGWVFSAKLKLDAGIPAISHN